MLLDNGIYAVYTLWYMQRAIVNVKVNPITKKRAQKIAEQLGLSLSALVNAFLTDLIKTKKVTFHADEVPTPRVAKILRQAEKDRKAGKGSPLFYTAEEAIKFLDEQRAA